MIHQGLINGCLLTKETTFDLIGPNDLKVVAQIPAFDKEDIAFAFQQARSSQKA